MLLQLTHNYINLHNMIYVNHIFEIIEEYNKKQTI